MTTFFIWLCLLTTSTTLTESCGSAPEKPPFGVLNAELMDRTGRNPAKYSILIDKTDYRLVLKYDKQDVKAYQVVLGGDPVNDKRREGDSRTPEGKFKIRSKYKHKNWSRFMWIDYPTDESWRRHRAAKASGEIPGNSSIGGEIGIHGVPEGQDDAIDEGINWTLGCISLKNKDVNELYEYVGEGTVVEIVR